MRTLSRIIMLSSFCLVLPLAAHAQSEAANPDLARMVDVFSAVMRSGPIVDPAVSKAGVSQKISAGAAVLAKGGTLLINSPFGVVSWGQDGKMKLHRDPATFTKAPSRPGNFKPMLGHKRPRKTTKDLPAQAFAALAQGNLSVRLRPNGMGFGAKSYTAETRPLEIRIKQADRYIDVTVAPNGRLNRPRITARKPFGFRQAPKRAR